MADVPLREHVEALDRAHDEVHKQEATVREEVARRLEHRLEGLNELRTEVITDRSRMVSREAFDAKIDALNVRIDSLDAQIKLWKGKGAGLSLSGQILMGVITLAAVLAAVWLAQG